MSTIRVVPITLALTLLASPAYAAQALILDTGTYDHVADNSARNTALGKGSPSLKGSHAFFATTAAGKSSWVSPVPYRDGQLHVVVDVLGKPSAAEVRLSLCMDDAGVTCVGTASFTKSGRYAFAQKPGAGYTAGNPDYTKGFGIAAVILRDGGANEGKKLDLGQGFIGEPDYTRYFPLKMRVRAYLVSPGAAFVPPGPDAADAGASDAGDAADGAATVPDGGGGGGGGSGTGAGTGTGARPEPAAEAEATPGASSTAEPTDDGCASSRSGPARGGWGSRAGLALVVAAVAFARRRRSTLR